MEREQGVTGTFLSLAEFQGLTLSDSRDGHTLGPLPPGGIWSSDGEYSAPPYDYFQNKSATATQAPANLHLQVKSHIMWCALFRKGLCRALIRKGSVVCIV